MSGRKLRDQHPSGGALAFIGLGVKTVSQDCARPILPTHFRVAHIVADAPATQECDPNSHVALVQPWNPAADHVLARSPIADSS